MSAGTDDLGRVASLEFASAARAIGSICRHVGWEVPGFRSPPTDPAATRSLRRHGTGVTVAVRLAGRTMDEVIADMVAGVIEANELTGREAIAAQLLLAMAAAAQ